MIPQEITNLVTELQSGRNDGYAEAAIRRQLKEIRDYIIDKLEEYDADKTNGGQRRC